MAYDIGPRIGIDGEEEFRSGLVNLNNQIKTLGTEMKAVTSSFEGEEKSVQSLTAQNDVLERTVTALNERLEMQKRMLAESTAAYGETDNRTLKWQQTVHNTEAELNRANAQIRQNQEEMERLSEGTEDVGESMEDAGEKASLFGDVLKGQLLADAVKAGLNALAGAVKEIAGAFKDAVLDGAAFADNIITLSTNTGLSTEQLQEFQYMAELTDTSLDTITGSMKKLITNMDSARGGTGSAADAFKELGVNVTNADGSLRSNQEVFGEVIDALGTMTNETERDALSMALFGKSAQDLNSFIAQGSEGIAAYAQEAHDMGYVLDDETLSSLGAVDDAMQRFTNLGVAAKNMLASALAPTVTGVADTVLPQLTSGLKSVSEAFEKDGLPGALDAAMSVMGGFAVQIGEALPGIVSAGQQMLDSLLMGFLQNLPEAVKSAAQVLQALTDGIAASLPVLIPAAVEAVGQIVETLTEPDTLVALIDGALAVILALADGLVDAIPKLLEAVPTIVGNLVQTIVQAAPKLLDAADELILKLAEGIVGGVVEVLIAIDRIIAEILEALREPVSDMVEAGRELVRGLWDGIRAMGDWIKERVEGFFSGVVDSVKGLLGIHSPSTVFAGIGENMALGLGEGFEDSFKDIRRQIRRDIPSLSAGLDDLAGIQAGYSASAPAAAAPIGTGYNGGNPSGAVDVTSLAQALTSALHGTGVYLDGYRAGRIITGRQRDMSMAMG